MFANGWFASYNGDSNPLSVVVEHGSELYSLVIDGVGDVFCLRMRIYKIIHQHLTPYGGIYQRAFIA